VSVLEWFKRLWSSWFHPSDGAAGERPAGAEPPPSVGGMSELRLLVGVSTTVGNYRDHNEDNFYVPGVGSIHRYPEGLPRAMEAALLLGAPPPPAAPGNGRRADGGNGESGRLDPFGPFLVADGMGGQLAGEQASRIAVEIIPKEMRQRLGDRTDAAAVQTAIREAVAAANREIIAQAHVVPECTNMGTTVVLALFRAGKLYVAGIGDSRVYRLRKGRLERLTRDHDLASALTDAGTIRPEEAEHHQFRHVLYLYLGSQDAHKGPEEVKVVDVRPGDAFLLASDGLTGVVADAELVEVIEASPDPQSAARALVQRALERDSKDNVTCMVLVTA